jgi:hypothetical protein
MLEGDAAAVHVHTTGRARALSGQGSEKCTDQHSQQMLMTYGYGTKHYPDQYIKKFTFNYSMYHCKDKK